MEAQNEELKYFRIAKKLNEKHQSFLKEKQLHFRGNINSFSLVSYSQETPELGKSGLKSENYAEKLIHELKLEEPKRPTKEKNIQAFIIKYAYKNNGKLPFGDFKFITSELAIKLDNKKRIVNDILAIDSNNNIAIIELKSIRDNYVKQQTILFEEKVIIPQHSFIKDLIFEIIGKNWSGKVRKIAIWPAPINSNKKSKNTYSEVELLNYKILKGTPLNIEQVDFEKE